MDFGSETSESESDEYSGTSPVATMMSKDDNVQRALAPSRAARSRLAQRQQESPENEEKKALSSVLDADVQRVESILTDGVVTITVQAGGFPPTEVDVMPTDNVKRKVEEALGQKIHRVLLGTQDVSQGTVEENNIEVGALCCMCPRVHVRTPQAGVRRVLP